MTAVDGEVFDLLGSSTSARSVVPSTRDGTTFSFYPVSSERVINTPRRDGYTFDLVGSTQSSSRAFGAKREGTLFNLADFSFDTRFAIGAKREGQTFFTPGGGPSPVTTYYGLAAVDTGVGRRYWSSLTVDFASAPTPVGTWVPASLTILSEWT